MSLILHFTLILNYIFEFQIQTNKKVELWGKERYMPARPDDVASAASRVLDEAWMNG